MKRLDDLNISKNAKKEVQSWINEYIEHFKNLADGQEGNVFRNDFENDDIFFWTNCNDIVEKYPDEKDKEVELMRKRKRNVLHQIFLKYLLGENIDRKAKCSHCGGKNVLIDSYSHGGYRFCPDCKMISPYVHPGHYLDAMREISLILYNNDEISKEDIFGENHIVEEKDKKWWKFW